MVKYTKKRDTTNAQLFSQIREDYVYSMLITFLNIKMKFIEFSFNYVMTAKQNYEQSFNNLAGLAKSLKCGRLMKSCNTVIEEKYDPFAIEQAINSYLEALKYFAERVNTKEDKLMHELMVFNHKYILTNLSWIPHGFEI